MIILPPRMHMRKFMETKNAIRIRYQKAERDQSKQLQFNTSRPTLHPIRPLVFNRNPVNVLQRRGITALVPRIDGIDHWLSVECQLKSEDVLARKDVMAGQKYIQKKNVNNYNHLVKMTPQSNRKR